LFFPKEVVYLHKIFEKMVREKYIIPPSTLKYRTVKPEEIIAAGGADAWAKKVGYSFQALLEGLKDLPATDMTDEEWLEALKNLEETK
jgi:hypothetical protein